MRHVVCGIPIYNKRLKCVVVVVVVSVCVCTVNSMYVAISAILPFCLNLGMGTQYWFLW
jgi:hypothetical protein